MPARGYTTIARLESYLGLDLTTAQETEAGRLIEAAEQLIDVETGKAWLVATAVTNEAHYRDHLGGPLLFLRSAPVASVTSVTGRGSWNDTTETTLVAGTDYELRDSALGTLYVPAWSAYQRLRVTYTPTNVAAPELLVLATNELVAWWLQPLLNSTDGVSLTGIKSFSLGGDLSVTYADTVAQRGIPPGFEQKLMALGKKALVFT